jgi:RES domain-containing protein
MPQYRLLGIDIPDDLQIDDVTAAELTGRWDMDLSLTRAIGDTWLEARQYPVLRVPSVVASHTWNILLNPLHPALVGVTTTVNEDHVFDPRLVTAKK